MKTKSKSKGKKKTKEQVRIGYMDLTDFTHELGEAAKGTRIYASKKDCALNQPCTIDECGIVKVEVKLLKIVKKAQPWY